MNKPQNAPSEAFFRMENVKYFLVDQKLSKIFKGQS